MIGDKFFFMDAKDIEQVVLICKNDGYGKSYQSIGRKSANEIFVLNDIPLEYQKIVLRSSIMKKLKSRMTDNAITKQNNYYAEEYISNFAFCEVVQSGKKGKVSLINDPFFDDDSKQWFFNYITCLSDVKSISSSAVVGFFTELKQEKLLDSYFKSLEELFSMNKVAVNNIKGRKDDFEFGGYQKVLK